MNNKIISFCRNCSSYKGKKWGFLLTFIMFFSLLACGQNGSSTTWQEQYDLGVRYLSEGNYEEAILAFTAAIEIDQKNADAYIGAAKAYEAMVDIDSALSILQQGLDATRSEDILALIEKLSGPHNLTGAKMFTLEDLEFPYGCSMYDLLSWGVASQKEIDSLKEDNRLFGLDENMSLATGITADSNPAILVWNYNGLIARVVIDHASPAVGPRGLCIGMSLEEVLSRFYCENEDALTYAKTFDQALIPASQEDGWVQLYEEFDVDENYKEGCMVFMEGMEGDQIHVYYDFGYVRLYIIFQNAFVKSIEVQYYYDEQYNYEE